jgi:hypothetical protein
VGGVFTGRKLELRGLAWLVSDLSKFCGLFLAACGLATASRSSRLWRGAGIWGIDGGGVPEHVVGDREEWVGERVPCTVRSCSWCKWMGTAT